MWCVSLNLNYYDDEHGVSLSGWLRVSFVRLILSPYFTVLSLNFVFTLILLKNIQPNPTCLTVVPVVTD